jgi:hypothetical protein
MPGPPYRVLRIEKVYEMARRLRSRLESCYSRVKRYNHRIATQEKKNKVHKGQLRPRGS